MKILNWLLRRTEPITEEPIKPSVIPEIGERWELKSDDPFPARYGPVKIIGFKNGWVRYYMNGIFNDERKELSSFIRLYRKCEK